jgi:predicted signal transduction protein with EAL and GGDEF domain
LRQPIVLDGQPIRALGSVGIALFPNDGATSEDLLRCADLAMYEAKSRGRDNVQFFSDELNAASQEQALLKLRLRQALAQDSFGVHYRPVRSLSSGQVVRAEVEIAWIAPELDRLERSEITTLAERAGLLRSLWATSLQNACTQLRAWSDRGLEPVPVCLHLSHHQLRSHDLSRTVQRCLEATGVDPSLLELEVPDLASVSRDQASRDSLEGLDALGVRLALGDVGTGAASLLCLSGCPARRLRLDEGLVALLGRGHDGEILARAIVAMAHHLDMSVSASGVKTERQVEALRELGCEEIQGPLVGSPLAANAFGRLLGSAKTSDADGR